MRRLALAILFVGATACIRSADPAPRLAPGDWRLATLRGVSAQPADVSRRPWLRFDVDSGRVSGSIGCNRGAGPFTLRGDTLRFGPIISTKMACADESLNRQETDFAGGLQSTDSHRIRGDTLELLGNGRVLATLIRSP